MDQISSPVTVTWQRVQLYTFSSIFRLFTFLVPSLSVLALLVVGIDRTEIESLFLIDNAGRSLSVMKLVEAVVERAEIELLFLFGPQASASLFIS
jgi:hypothetical protein